MDARSLPDQPEQSLRLHRSLVCDRVGCMRRDSPNPSVTTCPVCDFSYGLCDVVPLVSI